jgi:DNA-binding transcriptional LysR family regulator
MQIDVNWDDGRLFLAVARAGQMLGAARTLGLNQATLSRRMTKLERHLGAKLLVRRTTGCDLTEAGRALTRSLERVEDEFLASAARLRGVEAGLSGSLRIGAPDGFGVSFLAPRLVDLSARHPELHLQLVPVPRTFSLSQREADIAVIVGRPERGRLVGRKLTDYSLSLYASRDYLATRPPLTAPGDLVAHRLIGYVDDLVYAPSLNYSTEAWRSWRSHFEIASATGQLEAARAGAGIAILHDYLARQHEELTLVLPQIRIVRSYWTIYHESMRDDPRVRTMSAFLAETVHAAPTPFLRDIR